MITDTHARAELARLSVIHTQLNAAKTFEAFVDVVCRDQRLMNDDLTEAVHTLLASPDDVRIVPGRIIDYALRARSVRLASARKLRDAQTPGPSHIPSGDTCGRCGSTLEILVSERVIWCPTCRAVQAERSGIDTVKLREIDARTIDGEIRLWREQQSNKREAATA